MIDLSDLEHVLLLAEQKIGEMEAGKFYQTTFVDDNGKLFGNLLAVSDGFPTTHPSIWRFEGNLEVYTCTGPFFLLEPKLALVWRGSCWYIGAKVLCGELVGFLLLGNVGPAVWNEPPSYTSRIVLTPWKESDDN